MASTSDLIVVAVQRVQAETPALAKLKLVFSLELTAGGLTSSAKSEHFRVELPGPKVSEGEPEDARIALSVPKTMFTLLAEEGQLADWRDAFYYGHLKVSGDDRVKRLLGKAIGRA
ncbi:MAG: hypothetical protein ACHQJ5_00730 [Vicinamibacteria bacterium]